MFGVVVGGVADPGSRCSFSFLATRFGGRGRFEDRGKWLDWDIPWRRCWAYHY
jgi:hypothetical protein